MPVTIGRYFSNRPPPNRTGHFHGIRLSSRLGPSPQRLFAFRVPLWLLLLITYLAPFVTFLEVDGFPVFRLLGASVPMGLSPFRVFPRSNAVDVSGRFRCPVRALKAAIRP